MMETKNVIRQGSKSFFLASLFFDRNTKSACWDLYQWCRHCDDVIDGSRSPQEARSALVHLHEQWTLSQHHKQTSPPFEIVRSLSRTYKIPEIFFLDLLRGFAMDVENRKYQSIKELELYAYHVAGVVGIKMSYIMGLSDPQALKNAVDLGIAMQLTNIARDVQEDFAKGRLYLPTKWLNEENIDSSDLFNPDHRDNLYRVVLRLLDHADVLYRSGYRGLKFLPLRAAMAVSIAGSIYSCIGKKIRKKGVRSLEARTVVSFPEKIVCTVQAIFRVLPLAVSRLMKPWTQISLPAEREVA